MERQAVTDWLTDLEAARSGQVEAYGRELLQHDPRLLGAHGEVTEPHMRRISAHWGWPPLHLAAHYGHLTIVQLLVEAGAALEARALNAVGNTALGAAVWGDRLEVVRYLLEHGAAIDAQNHFGQSPLHRAVRRGSAAVTALLLARGADRALCDPDGHTPAEVAAELGNSAVLAAFAEANESHTNAPWRNPE